MDALRQIFQGFSLQDAVSFSAIAGAFSSIIAAFALMAYRSGRKVGEEFSIVADMLEAATESVVDVTKYAEEIVPSITSLDAKEETKKLLLRAINQTELSNDMAAKIQRLVLSDRNLRNDNSIAKRVIELVEHNNKVTREAMASLMKLVSQLQ